MAGWATALMALYLALAFGVRVAVQIRRTGSTGINAAGGSPIELLSGAAFLAGVIAGGAAPPLALAGALEPIAGLDGAADHLAGLVLCLAGIAGTFASQLQMGASWRIGVDADERTDLVTAGLFARVRNPIYSFMILAWLGFALLCPTWLALAAVPLLIAGLETQTRLVEEPHVLRVHGAAYRDYARRVGRFVPGVGRLD
ncbi:MAG: isoprenylcysteine carboxylmethyltransferase family protein [Solirubrobacterales bacterium]|nr:isoprenylcysteine carboxylmethyltransferase family protein [Solirubrobacterales bacterium]